MSLEAAFEHQLRGWLGELYDRAETISRRDDRALAEGIIAGQNRVLIGLVLILGASILFLPLANGISVIVALVILYVGAIVSSGITAVRIRRLEKSARRYKAIRRRDAAWDSRPPIGPDERAQLIRIMNLSRSSGRSARAALETELAEARLVPPLANWQALRDAAVLVRELPPPPADAYMAEVEAQR